MARKRDKKHYHRRSPKKSKDYGRTKKKKPSYKLRNWRHYNNALRHRGEIHLWIDKDAAERLWYAPEPEQRKRGAQEHYSDYAIESTLRFGKLFHQPLRQTEGFVRSIFCLMGLELHIPDYTTLCRREEDGAVSLSKKKTTGPIHVIADSSGVKVHGEGEWKVRKYGYSKHRTWRKLHLLITPEGEIRDQVLTGNNKSDGQMAPALLKQEEAPIASFCADGGLDKLNVYTVLQERQVEQIIIPPQHNAKIIQHGNTKGSPPHPRDENLRQIRKTSRKQWKKATGYHQRSKVETTFFRFKTIFGDHLQAHLLEHQKCEATIKCSLLNEMMDFGMPKSYRSI